MDQTIVVILPVYNERENLEPLAEGLSEVHQHRTLNVLMVDDGSDDGSDRVIGDLSGKYSWLRGIRLDKNHGQSAAFCAGFDHSEEEIIVLMDADGQNPPENIPSLIDALGDEDLVAGYRQNRKDSWAKRWGSKLANAIRGWVLGNEIRDTGCSLKAMRREVVESLPIRFSGMHRFIPSLALMKGYRVKQIPVSHRPRQHGTTKYSNFGRLKITIWDLMAMRWLQSRLIDVEVEKEL